jgi:hypothetical protein
MEADGDWFEGNPDRILRLRHITDGDPGREKGHNAVMVYRFEDYPGVRLRIPFGASRRLLLNAERLGDREIAPIMYEMAAMLTTISPRLPDEVRARLKCLAVPNR